jgi:hypothetical protein
MDASREQTVLLEEVVLFAAAGKSRVVDVRRGDAVRAIFV